MIVLVKKKDDATMTCGICGKTLVCRMSDYPHPYQNKLQWQDEDSNKAHFQFKDGRFTCRTEATEKKRIKDSIKFQDELISDAEMSKGSF